HDKFHRCWTDHVPIHVWDRLARNGHPCPARGVVGGRNMRDTPAQSPMATGRLLTVTSLLSLIFLTLHVSDDIARGISSLSFASMIAVLVVAMLLYATLTGEGRRAGAVSGFLIGLFALAMPALHFRGTRINEIAQSSGGLLFIWTLWALGVLGATGMILSVRALVSSFRSGKAPR